MRNSGTPAPAMRACSPVVIVIVLVTCLLAAGRQVVIGRFPVPAVSGQRAAVSSRPTAPGSFRDRDRDRTRDRDRLLPGHRPHRPCAGGAMIGRLQAPGSRPHRPCAGGAMMGRLQVAGSRPHRPCAGGAMIGRLRATGHRPVRLATRSASSHQQPAFSKRRPGQALSIFGMVQRRATLGALRTSCRPAGAVSLIACFPGACAPG